jgi:C-terminal processing protease CtpA/Prc
MKHGLVLLFLFGVLQVHAQTTPTPFDQVRALISSRYVSPSGYDVPAWLERTSARFAQECTNDCPRAKSIPLLRDALAELGDPHAFFSWPPPLEGGSGLPLGAPLQGNTYDFDARTAASGVVVTYVQPSGTAIRAGLRVGDIIKRLDNQTLSPERLLEELGRAEASGRFIQVVVLRAQKEQSLRLETRADTNFLQPALVSTDKSLPVLQIPYLTGLGIADRAIHDAVHEINRQEATKIVLDLRHNNGGTPYATANAAGAFIERSVWQLRDKENASWRHSFERGRIMDNSPRTQGRTLEDTFLNPAFFKGQVCVLVGPHTFSSGENFALLLQRFGHARIIGEPTFGGAGAGNNFFELTLGPELSLTTHLMFFEDGTRLPAKVTPDQIVPLDVDGLARGRDNQLEACRTWLQSQSSK